MSRQYWSETLYWLTASATAVAGTVTETVIVPDVTIPGNFMQDFRAIRAKLYGAYGTTGTPTLFFSARWGGVAGVVLCKGALDVMTSGVGGGASMTAMWSAEILFQTRTNGTTGTLMTNGEAVFHTNTLATAGTVTNYGMSVPIVSGTTGGSTPVVSGSCDLTIDKSLSITVKWGTSNAANSIQALNYTLEALN